MFPMSIIESLTGRLRQRQQGMPMPFEGGYNPYSGIKPVAEPPMMGGVPSGGFQPRPFEGGMGGYKMPQIPNPLNALNGLNRFGSFMGQARGFRKPGMMRSRY